MCVIAFQKANKSFDYFFVRAYYVLNSVRVITLLTFLICQKGTSMCLVKKETFKSVFDGFRYFKDSHYYIVLRISILCKLTSELILKVELPSKQDGYGIKIYVLADSLNYYPINFEIYSDLLAVRNNHENLVLRLCSIQINGHILCGDNFSRLFLYLLN